MTDDAQKTERREIADTLVRALERRHELLDVIVESEDYDAAVEAIASMLGTSPAGGEAVLRLSFDRLTKVSRRRIRDELTDLNHELSFTMGERQQSPGENLVLRPFSADADRDIFAARTDDVRAAGDGSGAPAGDLDDEIRAAVGRVHAEEAVWLVAIDGSRQGRHGVRRAGQRRGQRAHLDPPGVPQARLRHCRPAQVALGDGGVFPRGAAGGARTRRRAARRLTASPRRVGIDVWRVLSNFPQTSVSRRASTISGLEFVTFAPMATLFSSATRLASLLTVVVVSASLNACTPKPNGPEPAAEEFFAALAKGDTGGASQLTDRPEDARAALNEAWAGLQATSPGCAGAELEVRRGHRHRRLPLHLAPAEEPHLDL